MCSSSNSLQAEQCEVCGHAFDAAHIQIVVPMGGSVSALGSASAAPRLMSAPAQARVAPQPALQQRPSSNGNMAVARTQQRAATQAVVTMVGQASRLRATSPNAELARFLASTSTAAAAKVATPFSQVGIWMLISLLVLVGAVLATAAIFMNSTLIMHP